MSSSEDRRYGIAHDAAAAVLRSAAQRYWADFVECGNELPLDEYHSPGTFFELRPTRPGGAPIRLHPEDPGEVTVYVDGIPLYLLGVQRMDLGDVQAALEDVVDGVLAGCVVIEIHTRWFRPPFAVIRVTGASGREYRSRTDPPSSTTTYSPYEARPI